MTRSLVADDPERCYRAVRSRDARFDGVFFTGVRTTGIYCRPSCPAVTPLRRNVSFFVTAAAAHAAGLRACRRCLPDATPGSPEWNVRADAVGRAMRLIRDGVVEREGVDGLASRLGYSRRHVQRMLHSHLGAGPLALARSQRAHTARTLIETTTLPFADVAFAAGFASVRQFNDTIREVYARAPGQMRARRPRGDDSRPGRSQLRLRLAVRQPFDGDGLAAFLAARAVPAVEVVTERHYARVLRLSHGQGLVALSLGTDHVTADLDLDDLRDVAGAVQRCRALLDLDADPHAIGEVLGADPAMAPLVAARGGLRVPGHVDGFELAVRAVLGQQVSVARARTLAGDLVRRHGLDLSGGTATIRHGLSRAFPTPDALATADPTTMGMPASRGRAVVALATAVAAGQLDLGPGADRDETVSTLLSLPGVGRWTAGYIAMRALGDPDVFLEGDVVVRAAMSVLGLPAAGRAAAAHAFEWRPWRSYAVMHLWRHAAHLSSSKSTKERQS
ncbi:MAG: helix-turn-helix domain-containing protein [Actinomycetota bacterium]|nr:helix-turn-helix domain-containing protein [Actinomycetota bacterium]